MDRRPPVPEGTDPVPKASVADTVLTLQRVLVPLVARGLIKRRERIVAAAQRLDVDRTAIDHLVTMRERYGRGPLQLRVPGRRFVLVLEPDHVHRMLAAAPEPLAPANLEKRHALAQFQPEGALVSTGPERVERRRYNEVVLESDRLLHHDAAAFTRIVDDEADRLRADIDAAGGRLDWDRFLEVWYRIVRRVVLGDGAAEDHELTDQLAELRMAANWSYLRPTDRDRRAAFLERLRSHVERAEPGSLAATMAATPAGDDTDPVQQVPQWLFAFEPAGMVVMRTLAMLAAHPDVAAEVRDELRGVDLDAPQPLPLLRSCVLEALRLWPTTPGILRDTTTATRWDDVVVPAGSAVTVFAPLFHRDPQHVTDPDRFVPRRWLERATVDGVPDGTPDLARPPLVPFSGGPAICPGRNIVLLTTTTLLARLLVDRDVHLPDPDAVGPLDDLPSVFDQFHLEVGFTARSSAG